MGGVGDPRYEGGEATGSWGLSEAPLGRWAAGRLRVVSAGLNPGNTTTIDSAAFWRTGPVAKTTAFEAGPGVSHHALRGADNRGMAPATRKGVRAPSRRLTDAPRTRPVPGSGWGALRVPRDNAPSTPPRGRS